MPPPSPGFDAPIALLAMERRQRSIILNALRVGLWLTLLLAAATATPAQWHSIAPLLGVGAAIAVVGAVLSRTSPKLAAVTPFTLVVDIAIIAWIAAIFVRAIEPDGPFAGSASGIASFNTGLYVLILILAGMSLQPMSLAVVTPVAIVCEVALQRLANVGPIGEIGSTLVIALAAIGVAYATNRHRALVVALEDHQHRLETRVVEQARRIARREVEVEAAAFATRTAQLSREKVAAEMASAAKAQFLANMSHELRTPLNAVLGMSSLLAEADLADEHREQVEIIRASGEHVLGLINDILDFSKIDADKVELEALPISLEEVVEPTLDLVAASARERDVELAWEIAPGTPAKVVADPGRVRQVLLNLLSNGVKFTEHGAVLLTVSATREGRGHRLSFIVRDTGAGIPEEARARLFQAFSQGDASTTRLHGGTGLGLVISARLAARMGGAITFESEVGKGSTFTFTMVAGEAELTLTPPTGAMSSDRSLPISSEIGRKGAVVIAYRDALIRESLRRQLERWGLTPHVARNAEEAAEACRTTGASAVVLDGSLLPSAQERRDPTPEALTSLLGHGHPPAIVAVPAKPGRRRKGDTSPRVRFVIVKPLKLTALRELLGQILASEQPRITQRVRVSITNETPSKRLRVLVAEDNAVNQKVAAALLKKLGHTTDFVGNGAEAVAAVAQRPYDVVLMDVQMPEMDGLEATRQIVRRAPPGRRPRIVGLTAGAVAADREACLTAGMDDYLAKPVTLGALSAALARAGVAIGVGSEKGPERERDGQLDGQREGQRDGQREGQRDGRPDLGAATKVPGFKGPVL